MDQYISTLYEIVTRGLNTNSYKFALWRALATLAPNTSKQCPTISKHDLAPLFLSYYWPLEVKYHIRQGTDPDKDPIVMRLIRDLLKNGAINHGETLRNFQRRAPLEYKALVNKIAREAFDDVIPRFHTVHGSPITPEIFEFTGSVGRAGDTIQLTEGGRTFLIKYAKLITYVAISSWVRFTEGFTSAPKLHDKIDDTNLRRGTVSQWRVSLAAIQEGKCFYDASHDMTLSEVDHVMPWTFVLEDKTWNLVLACRECNNEKRDRLANLDAIRRLCARDSQISSGHIRADPAFLRHFAEWHSRDLSSHIQALYDQAVADGFPQWN
jgi:hypothetical protein